MILQSTITCPSCGFVKTETMPTDACQFFYDCSGCGTVLRPKPGDCCVYCSYADVPCPPIQEGSEGNCCASAHPSNQKNSRYSQALDHEMHRSPVLQQRRKLKET